MRDAGKLEAENRGWMPGVLRRRPSHQIMRPEDRGQDQHKTEEIRPDRSADEKHVDDKQQNEGNASKAAAEQQIVLTAAMRADLRQLFIAQRFRIGSSGDREVPCVVSASTFRGLPDLKPHETLKVARIPFESEVRCRASRRMLRTLDAVHSAQRNPTRPIKSPGSGSVGISVVGW